MISGRVMSFEDKKPVSYSFVFLKINNTGVYSDENGKFSLSYKDTMAVDTLVISCLGYKTEKIPVKEAAQNKNNKYFLRQSEIQLSVIEIDTRDGDIRSVGKIKGKSIGRYSTCSNYNFHVGRVFRLDTITAEVIKLRKVRIFITKEGVYNAPFRLHVYEIDKLSGKPQNDILLQDTIYKASNKNRWMEINVDSLNIIIPASGVCVAMEWLPGNSSYLYRSADGKNCYGPGLGMTKDIKESQYFVKSDSTNWWRPEFKNEPYVTNPMIYIEVEIFK